MAAADSGATPSLSPFGLAEALDHCAKWWWGASLTSKILGFGIGTCMTLLPAELVPFLVFACTLLAELCMYRSDAVKGTAQQFRRKLDQQDGFGWHIPPTELSDFLVRCSPSVKQRARNRVTAEQYFATAEPPGPRRALKNVSESAWWTKHLAGTMTIICWTTVIVGVIVSFGILIMAIQTTGTHAAQVNVARIVTAVLMLLLSMGIIKLAIGYSNLGKSSTRSEAAAERALETTPDELRAFKVMSDYHLSRAAGPIIPTWIWQLREKDLNQTWKELRNAGR